MEEGAEVVLDAELVVYTGESVPFPFYASSQRKDDALGDVVDPARAGLAELPPIEATIEGDVGKSVPARLHARVTELGTLEVSLVETASGKRTRLEFNIRVE
jgi:hypothetical protein